MAWHMDFETYSEADIKTVGGFRYAEHPSTIPLILAFSDGVHDPVGVDLTLPGFLEKLNPLFAAIERGEIMAAHNAHFERSIWEQKCLHLFPVVPRPEQWDCTAARARLLALPGSLDGVSRALGLTQKKDSRGMELIQLFSKPVKIRGEKVARRIMPHERPEEWQEFIQYCRQDVRVETAIDNILPPMPEMEKRAFILDFKINARGMPVNLEAVRRAQAFVEEYSETVLEKATAIAGCRPSQREKTMSYLASRGFELPNLQAATVEDLAKKPGLPQDLVELLDYRIELSRAGTKKLKTILECASPDGRLRGGFLFSAASTRRWSSTGVQMHNLQKPEGESNPDALISLLMNGMADVLPDFFTRPLTAMAQSIRGFLESDRNFLVADYSSVEPRSLAWYAREEWLLQAYRDKQDAYKIAAGKVYGIHPSQVDAHQRFMGKQLILGCGYGMGPPRFIETCAKFGQDLSLDDSAEAVYGYRGSVPNIVRLWKNLEMTAIRALRSGKEIWCDRLLFRPITLANGFELLEIVMPSGSIYYPKPFLTRETFRGELHDKFNFYTPHGSAWVTTDTFGGSLAENLCQSGTRDILRDGMVAADDAGFELVGHVHDEAIAEGDNNPADLKEFERHLCGSSPWAEGFPLASEGYIAKRYRK